MITANTCELRKTGVDVVGDIPWGSHFCLFYDTKADLLETTVSYCKAGLQSEEFCLWVIAPPVTEEDAHQAMRKAVPDFDRYLLGNSIEIVTAREWYLPDGTFDLKRVIAGWNEKLARASAKGYAGVRVTGDTAWLERKHWNDFCEYEDSLNGAIANQRLAVLCTYPLAACGAAEILDVVRTHQFAVTRRRGSWDVIETAGHKQAKAEIKRLNEELEQRVIERTSQLAAVNQELTNEVLERQRAEEALQKAFDEIKKLKDQLYRENLALRDEIDRASMFQAKIRRLVDANIIGIFFWDVEGQIVETNDAFLRIVGYDREDLASGRVRRTDLTPAEWCDRDERAIAELKASGVFQPYEKEYFRKDGSRVPILVGGARSEDIGNEGVAFILDLREQKRAEEALRQAFDEIKKLKDQLYRENLALRDEIDRASMFEEVVGTSPALQEVVARIAKVAPTESTVLITGETGTGKELFARAIHKRSRRSERAFVSVNCAALAPSLISSELFGHEKGAFTGATQRRPGRFEMADGGTIFLDEVGELPTDTQVALLRVLQEREFERVGGTQSIHVDVRVIAATNRDLKSAKTNGTFRPDLFYRLNVFPIEAPALRERKDDIRILVEYFVKRYASRAGKIIRSIDKKTLELLQSYDWPGNIRELQNVVERSVILTSGDALAVDESWLSRESSQPSPRSQASRPHTDDELEERLIIEAALRETKGRVAGPMGAAAKLRIPPSTLDYKIKTLKIRKSQFKFG
jgi:PAS domain S-box-containing protein